MIIIGAQIISNIINYGNIEFYLMKKLYYIHDPNIYDKNKKPFNQNNDIDK